MTLFYPKIDFGNPGPELDEKNEAGRLVLEALYKDLIVQN